MRRLLWLVSLAMVVAVAGCASRGPAYQAPEAPVPAAWPSSAAALAGEVGQVPGQELGWRDFILDERLRQVIAMTLEHNRDLRIAALHIERARALQQRQGAARVPNVSLQAASQRKRDQGRVTSDHELSIGVAGYEIDLFGRLKALDEAAAERHLQSGEAQRALQMSLLSEVSVTWLTLGSDRQRLQVARETLASREAASGLVARAHALGAQSGLAALQARALADAARVDMAELGATVEQRAQALALLVGSPVPDALWPGTRLDVAAALPSLPALLPSELLRRRPDVQAAEHLLKASHFEIDAARADFFPRITLSAALGFAGSPLSALFDGASRAWQLLPALSLPVADGGRRQAGLSLAKIDRDVQLASYEQVMQRAFRELADALAARAAMAERMAAQQALFDGTQRSLALAEARFRAGADSYLEVLDAQRTHYQAAQALIGTTLAEQVNRVQLYKALGGGWTEHTAAAGRN